MSRRLCRLRVFMIRHLWRLKFVWRLRSSRRLRQLRVFTAQFGLSFHYAIGSYSFFLRALLGLTSHCPVGSYSFIVAPALVYVKTCKTNLEVLKGQDNFAFYLPCFYYGRLLLPCGFILHTLIMCVLLDEFYFRLTLGKFVCIHT